MKKILKLSLIFSLLIFTLVACDKAYKRILFKVETGDNINVILNTDDGYNMTTELPIEFTKNEEVVGNGIFITLDTYAKYEDIINKDNKSTIIESGDKNGVHYIFYNFDNREYNYIMKIDNSNTGFILGNPNSQDSAEECFGRLTFSKE